MSEAIYVQGDLDVLGSVSFGQFTDFPPNPRMGSAALVNRILYVYMEMGGVQSWYPLTQHTSSYIHTQGLPSQTWTVNHNLATTSLWIQVKDHTGNILIVSKQDVNVNTFTLHFTSPVTGTCVVVAPSSVNVPTVKATVFEIGNGDVVLDSSGVRVNNVYLAPTTALAAKADLVDGKVPLSQLPDNLGTSSSASPRSMVFLSRAGTAYGLLITSSLGLIVLSSNAVAYSVTPVVAGSFQTIPFVNSQNTAFSIRLT